MECNRLVYVTGMVLGRPHRAGPVWFRSECEDQRSKSVDIDACWSDGDRLVVDSDNFDLGGDLHRRSADFFPPLFGWTAASGGFACRILRAVGSVALVASRCR